MESNGEFNKNALIVLYPDGTIESLKINDRILHMEYFIQLNNPSSKLHRILKKNNIFIPKSIYKADSLLTYDLDTDLAKRGIVVLHNLFIDLIQRNEKAFQDTPPYFYISLPNTLSSEQIDYFEKICSTYDMSTSLVTRLVEDELIDITYEDMQSILEGVKTK